MKKFVSMLLIVLTLLSCSVPAFAADEPTEQSPELVAAVGGEDTAILVINEDGSISPLAYTYTESHTYTFKTITVYNKSVSEMKVSSGLKSMTIASGNHGTLSFSTSKSRTVTFKCNNTISFTYSVT